MPNPQGTHCNQVSAVGEDTKQTRQQRLEGCRLALPWLCLGPAVAQNPGAQDCPVHAMLRCTDPRTSTTLKTAGVPGCVCVCRVFVLHLLSSTPVVCFSVDCLFDRDSCSRSHVVTCSTEMQACTYKTREKKGRQIKIKIRGCDCCLLAKNKLLPVTFSMYTTSMEPQDPHAGCRQAKHAGLPNSTFEDCVYRIVSP